MSNISNSSLNSSCDVSLALNISNRIFKSGESIKFKHILSNSSIPFNISYWVEDLEGNFVRQKFTTSNINEKSYTPSIKANEKVLILKSYVYVACNDSNFSNNFASVNLVIVNPDWVEEELNTSTSMVSSKNTSVVSSSSHSGNPTVKSFYTRTLKFEAGKNITLFGSLDNYNSNFSVLFKHNNFSVPVDIVGGKFSIPATILPGDNNLSVQIRKDDQLFDSKLLFIETASLSEPLSNEAEIINLPSTESVINQSKSKLSSDSVVYESSGKQLSEIVKYVFLGLSALLNVALIAKR